MLAGAALLCLAFLLGADKAPAEVHIEGFVYDSCGGCFTDNSPCKPCKVVLELEEYLNAELDRLGAGEDRWVEVHNVLYDDQKKLLSQRLSKDRLGEMEYPVVILDDTVLYGWEQIKRELAPAVLARTGRGGSGQEAGEAKEPRLQKAGSDTVVYFKMQACGSCRKTGAFLEELLGKHGDFELLTYEMEDRGNLELFQAYCNTYGMDAENTFVPVIFIGDRCLEGFEEVQLFLESYLEAGYAGNTYRAE